MAAGKTGKNNRETDREKWIKIQTRNRSIKSDMKKRDRKADKQSAGLWKTGEKDGK